MHTSWLDPEPVEACLWNRRGDAHRKGSESGDIGEGGGTHPSQGLIEPALADADCLHDVLDDTEALGDDLVMPSEDPAAVAEDLEDDNELGIVDDLHDDLMVFDLPYG